MVFETITFLSIYQYNFEIYDTLKSLKFTDFEKYNKNSFTAKMKYICYILISKFSKNINLTWNWVKVSPRTSPESMIPRYTVPPFPVLINPLRLL